MEIVYNTRNLVLVNKIKTKFKEKQKINSFDEADFRFTVRSCIS